MPFVARKPDMKKKTSTEKNVPGKTSNHVPFE
jgi:hypothetical protein